MATKIRLKRMGAKKAPFYHIVVADSRSPRDGKYLELIGFYNPLTDPAEIKVNEEGIEAAIEKIERQMDAVNQETSAALQKARKASSFKDVMYNAELFRDLHEKQEKAISLVTTQYQKQ